MTIDIDLNVTLTPEETAVLKDALSVIEYEMGSEHRDDAFYTGAEGLIRKFRSQSDEL